MSNTVELYSFTDQDRSGKVRWTAAEIGLEIAEKRVEPGAHMQPPYADLNPFGQIPTARFAGEVFVESTAICRALIDAHPESKLDIDRGAAGRQEFHYWLSLLTENFEARLVECAISRLGILGPEYFELHKEALTRKLSVILPQLPKEGYLCGEQFTLVDICAGYCLRLAISCEFIETRDVQPYYSRLQARPAAIASRVFG